MTWKLQFMNKNRKCLLIQKKFKKSVIGFLRGTFIAFNMSIELRLNIFTSFPYSYTNQDMSSTHNYPPSFDYFYKQKTSPFP